MTITKDTLLLFDFGCILVNLDKTLCIKSLKEIGCGKIASYVDEHRSEDLFHDIELGRPTADFCHEARRQSAYIDDNGLKHACQATDKAICQAWNSLLTSIDVSKLRLIRQLRERGFRTAILSNTNRIHWKHAVYDLFTVDGLTVNDYFDHVFLSCDLGIVKPDPAVYQAVMDTMHVTADNVFFIDDSLKNCRGAQAMGFHTMHDPDGTLWEPRLTPLLQQDSVCLDQQQPTAAIIGNFDGVHRGHQFIIQQLKEEAKKRGLKTLAITFDRHPRALFDPNFQPTYISTPHEKTALLHHYGVDDVRIFPFTADLASVPAREFMQQTLHDTLGVKLLLLGYDNRFGKKQEGEGYEDYCRYGEEIGIEVKRLAPIDVDEDRVSSSLIRREIKAGNIDHALRLLGHQFEMQGYVVHGRAEGRRIGFPTANIEVDNDKLIPQRGVYAVKVYVEGHSKHYYGMTNIGIRPTFADSDHISIETHLIDCNTDLYNRRLHIHILKRLRDEVAFPSAQALRQQLEDDLKQVQQLVATHSIQ